MYDPHALVIYTDGSAFDNPGKRCGWGMVVQFPDSFQLENEEYKRSVEGSTVNRMELGAVIAAIEYAKIKCRELRIQRVIIVTDSSYVVSNWRKAQYWRRDKWCNKDGRPTENSDLWKKLLSVLGTIGVRLDIEKVAGKSTKVTKRVDKLAKEAATSDSRRKDFGFVGGKVSRPRTREGVSILYSKGGDNLIVRVYRYIPYKYDGALIYKVLFELCKEDFSVSVGAKFHAYYRPATEIDISRNTLYRVRFNKNSRFPTFELIERL
jgi:ribonuclease HI